MICRSTIEEVWRVKRMKGKTLLVTILGTVVGMIGGAIMVGKKAEGNIEKWKDMSDKHLSLFLLMNAWMKKKKEGKEIKLYFEKNNYQSIAVYGLSYVGERVLDELEESGVEVKYAIDKNADFVYTDLVVYKPEDKLPDVDVVVVTAVYFFEEINEMLSSKMRCPIVSLEDILHDI